MYIQVLRCDACHKLIEDESKATVIPTKDLSFCEDCIRSVKGFQKKFKDLRAYHVLVDIVANMLADDAIAEEEKKQKSSTSGSTSTAGSAASGGTNGFLPPATKGS